MTWILIALIVASTLVSLILWRRTAKADAVSERWLLDHVYLHGKSGDL